MKDRCPDCYAKSGDLQFHRDKQCVMRQLPSAQRQGERASMLLRIAEHFWQRADDFANEHARASKANRRRARFNRDASIEAARAIEFKERFERRGW